MKRAGAKSGLRGTKPSYAITQASGLDHRQYFLDPAFDGVTFAFAFHAFRPNSPIPLDDRKGFMSGRTFVWC